MLEAIFAPAYRSQGCDDERALASRSANMVAEQDRRRQRQPQAELRRGIRRQQGLQEFVKLDESCLNFCP